MMQETSLKAYEEVKESLGKRQKVIYAIIKMASLQGKDITNLEITQFVNLPINSVTPRVFELRQKDLVEEKRKRVCAVSGRRAIAWRVK